MKRLHAPKLYIDVRRYTKDDELSYDLSQHLPRRLGVGPILVIADNPPVFLSVIRKRLARMQSDIERERARTLDRRRRQGLTRELLRLGTTCFTTKSQTLIANPDVLFVDPYNLTKRQLACTTLYVTTALSSRQLLAGLQMLTPDGLLVIYGDWSPQYGEVIAGHRMVS